MKNDMKSRRVQAQRKFAQGAYIPPILNNNVVAARTDLVQAPAVKEEKPTTYSNSSAKCLLDIVSFQGLHTHLQPVVLLKRLDNPKESQMEAHNGHVAETEKRPPVKEPKVHSERPHVPVKKPRLAARTSTMCLRSRAPHSKLSKKVSKKKTKKPKLKKISHKNGVSPNKGVFEYMSSTSEDERPLKYFKKVTNNNVVGSPDSETRNLLPKSPRRVKKRRQTSAVLAATLAEVWGSMNNVLPKRKKCQNECYNFAVNEGASTSKDYPAFKQPQVPPRLSRRMQEKMATENAAGQTASDKGAKPAKRGRTACKRSSTSSNDKQQRQTNGNVAGAAQICLLTPNAAAADETEEESGDSRSSSIAPQVYSDTDESDKPSDLEFAWNENVFKWLEYDRFSLVSSSEGEDVPSESINCVSETLKTVSDVSKVPNEELDKRCKKCIYCRRVDKVLQISELIYRPCRDVYEFVEEDAATARLPLSTLKLSERIRGIRLTRVLGKVHIYLEVFTKDSDQMIAIVPTSVANFDKKIMRARLVKKSKAQPSKDLNLKAHEKLLDVIVEVMLCSDVMRSDVKKLLLKAARQLQKSRLSRRLKWTPRHSTAKRPRRQATLKRQPRQPTKRPRARRTNRKRTLDKSTEQSIPDESIEEQISDQVTEESTVDKTTERSVPDESIEELLLDQSLQELIPDQSIEELMPDNLMQDLMPDPFVEEPTPFNSTQECMLQQAAQELTRYQSNQAPIPRQATEETSSSQANQDSTFGQISQEPQPTLEHRHPQKEPPSNQSGATKPEVKQHNDRNPIVDDLNQDQQTPEFSDTPEDEDELNDIEIITLNSPEDSTIKVESDDEIEFTDISMVNIPDGITINQNMNLFMRNPTGAKLLEAPTFTPSPEEFTDPMAFFEKIAPTASKFGICRVVAPPGFNPKCVLTDDLKFNVANQYIARLYSRWGPAAREMSAIKACLASQKVKFTKAPLLEGMELNLPLLYLVVQRNGGLNQVNEKKRWARVADEMRFPKNQPDKKLDGVYLKYLVPYETLSNQERQQIMGAVEKGWIKKNRKLNDWAMNPLHRQKKLLGESDSSEDEAEDEPHVAVALTEAEDCVVRGRKMNLSAFRKVSTTAQTTFFPSDSVTLEQVEKEYWKLVLLGTDHVCVNSASIDTGDGGYGFSRGKSDPISRHPWNLKLLSMNMGNVLRSMGAVVGVTLPTLHLGMVFSTSCWHRDPHGLPWIEYMHDGPGKVWYGIPDEQSSNFRKAVETLCPTSCQNKSIWLPSDITMIPPNLLQEHNVSLSRVTQKPGEFIIVFPKSYSCSIATGYTVSESVYFATNSWLKTVHLVFQELRDNCEPTTFSLEHMLISLACDPRVSLTVLQQVHASLSTIVREEQHNRRVLRALEITTQVSHQKKKSVGAWNVREHLDCEICRTTLYLSMVTGITGKQSSVCLQHAVRLIEQPKYASIDLSTLTVVEYFTETELQDILTVVEERLAPTNNIRPELKRRTTHSIEARYASSHVRKDLLQQWAAAG